MEAPTASEIDELVSKCTTVWTTINGVNGRRVTGPNGNSIFLPATGYHQGRWFDEVGDLGFYWSAMPYQSESWFADQADGLYFDRRKFNRSHTDRYVGQSVRPVSE